MSEEATLEEFTNTADEKETNRAESKASTQPYPQDWERVQFKNLIGDIRYGTDTKSNASGQGYPTFRIPNIVGRKITTDDLKYTPLPDDEAERLKLEKGDILLVRTNGNPDYVGQCALFDEEVEDSIFASYLIRIRVDESYLTEFVTEFLNSRFGRKEMSGWINTSAGNHNIGIGSIENFIIPLPHYNEQRKIATVLYTVDQAIQKTEEIIEQIQRAKKGVVQDVLISGLGKSELSETDTALGQLPEHWEVATISEIVADEDHAFTDGARYSLSSDEIHDDGDARAVLLQEVGEDVFNDTKPKFATTEKYEEITHRAIYPGEVVVAKMAEPVARACIIPEKYDKHLLGCADVVRILTNDEYDSQFLMYCMNSHKIWRQAAAHLRGTGRSRINLENISDIEVPNPPLHEQVQIRKVIQ